MTHFKNTLIAAGMLTVAGLSPNTVMGGRIHHQNAAGGITSGAGSAFQGANGGGFANGHHISTDGAGNASGVNGAVGTTANGGQFSRSADGSVNHQSSGEAGGQQGSVSTSGNTGKKCRRCSFHVTQLPNQQCRNGRDRQ